MDRSSKAPALRAPARAGEIAANESAGYDFSLRVLKNDFARGVELLADNVLHPALPDCPGHEYWQRDFKGASGLFNAIPEAPALTAPGIPNAGAPASFSAPAPIGAVVVSYAAGLVSSGACGEWHVRQVRRPAARRKQ